MTKQIPVAEVTTRLNSVVAATCGRLLVAASRLRLPHTIPQSAVAELLDNLAGDLEGDVQRLEAELKKGRQAEKAGETAETQSKCREA